MNVDFLCSDFPVEVLLMILDYLGHEDALNLALTSRKMDAKLRNEVYKREMEGEAIPDVVLLLVWATGCFGVRVAAIQTQVSSKTDATLHHYRP